MRLLSWLTDRSRQKPAQLFAEPEFCRHLKIERLRSDRSGLAFCLIRLQLMSDSATFAGLERLTDLLVTRLRFTDILGHIGPFKAGVILPDTPEAGGKTVLQALQVLLNEADLQCALALDVYVPGGLPLDEDSNATPSDLEPNVSTSHNLSPPSKMQSESVAPNMLLTRRPINELLTQQISVFAKSKRAFDFVIALLLLCFSLPVMALIALVIRCTSTGPVIFRQVREGKGGKPFVILKFRTMIEGAEAQQAALRKLSQRNGPAFKMRNDPRVTRVGAVLRASCLDELPQLINVLRGDMSLVGPRPLPLHESRQCKPWQRRRLDVLPGLTGHWQVGNRDVSFDDWMRSDLRYVGDYSMLQDVGLMLKSLRVVTLGKGHH